MVVRAGRRYRLVGGLVAIGALLPLVLTDSAVVPAPGAGRYRNVAH
jgi:hypothetical protein